MKKSLIALAVLAASGSAMAQSSVTMFGIVDLAVSRIAGNNGVGHKWGMSEGSQSTSRLGFRGTEDLGGGLAASFWLEGEVFADDGNGTTAFNFLRRSTVSLSGNFGEVRLGRDFIPTYLNVTGFDVFGTRGVAQSKAAGNFAISQLNTNNADVRASNMVQYYLPNTLGGFYGNVAYAFGESQSNQVNNNQGNMFGGRVGYANGPVNVSVAYSRIKQAVGATAGTTTIGAGAAVLGKDLKIANIAGTYDFGVLKLWGFIGREKVDNTVVTAATTNAVTSSILGVTAPLGAGELRATIAHYDSKGNNNDSNKFGIGYGYNLSKRTQLYGTFATVKNKGTGAPGANSITDTGITALAVPAGVTATRFNGFDFGIRHSF